jgi:nitroreductase
LIQKKAARISFLELAKKRQSVRKYLTTPVPREKIERCLEAARLAPSACNSQPWEFIVVEGELKDRLAPALVAGAYSMNRFACDAPVWIVVLRRPSGYAARLGGMLRGVQYNLIDIGIAGDHLTLQAAEEGLGTCWLGWFNEKQAKKILNLPRSVRIDIVISLGYAADETIRDKKRKPLDEIRTYCRG